jgi:glycosyltransferase involved in cell wall biosynthesis
MAHPTCTIITPSLNDLRYLRRCCASVDDQESVHLQHIVVDGGSRDGTVEWLRSRPRTQWVVKQDAGVYEALNAGLDLATGEWVGFLNCDEQYLPGGLRAVVGYIATRPQVDMVTGNFLVVRPDGNLICHRTEIPPRSVYIRLSYLYTFTCALFVRKRFFEEGLRFDASLKSAADELLVLRLLERARVGHLQEFVAAFTDRPEGLSGNETARAETANLRRQNPVWQKALQLPILAARHLEKAVSGGYSRHAFLPYELYTETDERRRQRFVAQKAPGVWKGR